MVTSNHINKTNRLSYYNRSNNFINLEYFHNFVTGKGYFEVTINPARAPKNESKLIKEALGDGYYTVTLEKSYWTYVKELCKRSPVSQKEIEKQIEDVYKQAQLKANDLMTYFVNRLTTYNLNDVVSVTYSLARDWKNIKIASNVPRNHEVLYPDWS